MQWNYGDVLDGIADAVPPETPLFIHGERTIGWGAASRRMNNIGRALLERGSVPGDKLALYLRNGPEYMEATGAGFRARLTHVNINYRYKPDEVRYIVDNADATVLIYSAEFRDAITQIRPQLPNVLTYLEVAAVGEIAPFANPMRPLPKAAQAHVSTFVGRPTTYCSSILAARRACPRVSCGAIAICARYGMTAWHVRPEWRFPTPSRPMRNW